jgi:hypothetical protein
VAEPIPEPPEVATIQSYPLPNAADEAWLELLALREKAAALDIQISDAWPIDRLRAEIAKAEAGRA